MKTNLIALSLGSALLCTSATAQAQSSVQLMGLTDVFVGSLRNAGDAGRATVLNSGGMTTSWFGVKGTEDLGGGLKANFRADLVHQGGQRSAGPLRERHLLLARCQRGACRAASAR